MMSDDEAGAARKMFDLSDGLVASESVQARRAGERIKAILRDLLYEHDPWSDVLSPGPVKAAYDKPLPIINDENRGHWEAARRHEFRLQRCLDCGYIRFPIAFACPKCQSPNTEWALLSGRGKVASWVTFHKAYWPGFANDLPYVVVQVELDEGPRYLSNLIEVEGRDITAGMAVEVVFDDVTERVTLPKFRLCQT